MCVCVLDLDILLAYIAFVSYARSGAWGGWSVAQKKANLKKKEGKATTAKSKKVDQNN